MIVGIGVDIVDARRIQHMIEQYGKKFLNRVFTQAEQDYADAATDPKRRLLRYANRFAAKEAFVKALEDAQGLSWQDIEVTKEPNGRPGIILHKSVNDTYNIHLSLSDEYPYSHAYIIIEKKPLI